MKILVLMQDGIPIEAFNVPKISRDWELEQFGKKVREHRTDILKTAFATLNPSKEPKSIGLEDLPTVATVIVELTNFCPEAQAIAPVAPTPST